MEKVDIAVIGGGAAGLMAACAAARVMKKAGAVLGSLCSSNSSV